MARKETFKDVALAINKRMKEPTERQQLVIYRRTIPAGVITRKWRRRPIGYCSECGCEMDFIGQKECPQCHVKWTAKPKKFERRELFYHMEMEAKGEVQVCRYFKVERNTHFGRAADWYASEVVRIMYTTDGERKVFAKNVLMMSYQWDAFCLGSSLRLRREGKYMGEYAKWRYNLCLWTYHIKSLTQQWQYKNIPELLNSYELDTSVLRVIAYPYGETLFKTGQTNLFNYFVKYHCQMPKGTEHALNICIRNHYCISDPSMWLDHLELLKHFKLDTHNAHYVCPADLRQAHQALLERKRRDDERREAERKAREHAKQLERMEKERQAYLERWGAVLSLHLDSKNLCVVPLQSVDEFAAEGAAMHHCVFTNGYYKKDSCLILSARDSDGKRLATIEYNTARHDIVQCRAACNAVPERDKEIRALIISHREDFERLMKQKEVSTNGTKKSKQQTAAIAA